VAHREGRERSTMEGAGLVKPMKLTHIFYSPSEMRPMDSYFSGNSWVSPAPSTDLKDRSKP
jgi:hypothetical protein